MTERSTAYRTCPLCEATCGLELSAHTMVGHLYISPLLRALRTRNRFSVSTVDQMPT